MAGKSVSHASHAANRAFWLRCVTTSRDSNANRPRTEAELHRPSEQAILDPPKSHVVGVKR